MRTIFQDHRRILQRRDSASTRRRNCKAPEFGRGPVLIGTRVGNHRWQRKANAKLALCAVSTSGPPDAARFHGSGSLLKRPTNNGTQILEEDTQRNRCDGILLDQRGRQVLPERLQGGRPHHGKEGTATGPLTWRNGSPSECNDRDSDTTAADLIEPREPKAAKKKPRAAETLEAEEPLQKRLKLEPEPAVPPRPQPSERQPPPAPSRPTTTATRAPPPPRTLTHRPAPTTSETRYNSREPSARTFRDTGRRDGSNYSSEWYGWYANDGENRYSGDAARNRHAGERRR